MIFKLKKAALNPKRLFLIDSWGALLSAILYGGVLAQLESIFGMPQKEVYLLTLLACIYAIYSGLCYFFQPKNWKPFLKSIAIANLIHCCLTIALVFFYQEKLPLLGFLYFANELVIVVGLAIVELKTASKTNNKRI